MPGLSNRETADVYRTYGHLVLRRCRVILRDDQLAEDALQNVFVKVMKYGSELGEARSQLAWLYRAADRCCYDLLGQRRRLAAEAPPEAVGGPHPDPTFEARDAVMKLLRRLRKRDRQIAVAAFVDGHSQEQIANDLGLTRQTVNRRLMGIRGRAQRLMART